VSFGSPRCALPLGIETALEPLRDAIDAGTPELATEVSLTDDGERLSVRFRAHDPAPWATLRERDADLWTEEVVELFIAPGRSTPKHYFEIEVNPLGTIFDARIESPHGDRSGMRIDRNWSCEALEVDSRFDSERGVWQTTMALPWRALAADSDERFWRLNLFRIDRPAGRPTAFSAWSPTLVSPADFHRPERFGFLVRLG